MLDSILDLDPSHFHRTNQKNEAGTLLLCLCDAAEFSIAAR